MSRSDLYMEISNNKLACYNQSQEHRIQLTPRLVLGDSLVFHLNVSPSVGKELITIYCFTPQQVLLNLCAQNEKG